MARFRFSPRILGVTIPITDGKVAMRRCVSVGAVLVAGAIVGGDVAGIAAPSPKSRFAGTRHNVPSVNVEFVIAVDVSYSMDIDSLPFSARAMHRPSSRKTSFRR